MALVKISIDEREVATLTLNRPDKSNAFDEHMIAELQTALDQLAQRETLRCLLLQAEGRHFSAGADLDWMRRMGEYNQTQNEQDARNLADLLQTLDQFAVPTIARVQGAAFGGALGLIACCDFSIATSDAIFALSEVQLGLIPAVIAPYMIAAIGARQARRYFVSAERLDAATAQRIGLLHETADPEQIDRLLEDFIRQILQAKPQAQHEAKALIRQVQMLGEKEEVTDYTVQAIARRRSSDEAQHALQAFLQKSTSRRPEGGS